MVGARERKKEEKMKKKSLLGRAGFIIFFNNVIYATYVQV